MFRGIYFWNVQNTEMLRGKVLFLEFGSRSLENESVYLSNVRLYTSENFCTASLLLCKFLFGLPRTDKSLKLHAEAWADTPPSAAKSRSDRRVDESNCGFSSS